MQAGRAYVLDTTAEEEECIEGALQLAVNAQSAICGMFKQGRRALHPAVMQASAHAPA
jgi:exosome complex RNA-binding protein Rrp42 (RNase PH superfamily)